MIAVTLYMVSRPNFFDDAVVASLFGQAAYQAAVACRPSSKAGPRLPIRAASRPCSMLAYQSLHVPLAVGHREDGRLGDRRTALAGDRGDLADRGLAAAADVERLAVVVLAEVRAPCDERLGRRRRRRRNRARCRD